MAVTMEFIEEHFTKVIVDCEEKISKKVEEAILRSPVNNFIDMKVEGFTIAEFNAVWPFMAVKGWVSAKRHPHKQGFIRIEHGVDVQNLINKLAKADNTKKLEGLIEDEQAERNIKIS